MQTKTTKKPNPSIPEKIGPYLILRSIGKGGMGEVFLARDPSCGRELALKRVRPDLSNNQTVVKRFLREATIASQLSHPSIIPIFAIASHPPEIYYTMPYVEGETLKKILNILNDSNKNLTMTTILILKIG